jgi:hypothetical protein
MQERLFQIQFMAANYSRLQGLRAVPIGMLAVFAAIWSLYNHGPNADLRAPILVAIAAGLLYWLLDRYYNHMFGEIKRTPRQRIVELAGSIVFGILGLLAFILDATQMVPISAIGIVFAISFLEYFSRAFPSDWGKIFTRFPENVIAATLILVISLLPLFGISWWHVFGIRSQLSAVFMLVGFVLTITGIWSHIRLVHALSAVDTRFDDNAV